jgi:protein-disulfide isomerase
MLKTRHLIFLLIPAFLILALAIFVRVIQYQPLTPPTEEQKKENNLTAVPIMPEDPILGNKKAPNTIIAFEDFGCDACKYQTNLLNQLLEKYPNKVKIIWKGLSVVSFPYPTTLAHQYAHCANKQGKFAEFKNQTFGTSDNLSAENLNLIVEALKLDTTKLTQCLSLTETKNYLSETENIARFFNIQSVPTFFINNQQITNPTSLEGWEAIISK